MGFNRLIISGEISDTDRRNIELILSMLHKYQPCYHFGDTVEVKLPDNPHEHLAFQIIARKNYDLKMRVADKALVLRNIPAMVKKTSEFMDKQLPALLRPQAL